MSCFTKYNNRNYVFKNLPSSTILSSKNSKELFEEKVDYIYNKNNQEYEKEIINIVCEKIFSQDKEFLWNKKNYEDFKKEITKIDRKDMKIISSSIKKSLITPNSNIYEQLILLSKEVEWYPIKEKKYDKENNKTIYKDKEIEVTDCFYIINNINSYINQYIKMYANNIVKVYIENDINYIIDVVKKDFLKGYIKNYRYLKKYPLFVDIYINGYKESLKKLSQSIRDIKNDLGYRKLKYTRFGSDINAQYPISLRKYQKGKF